ncbi:MAG: hypothetical protein B1H03_05925 [Planctomycetales bacterium 4484_113]|nr:MAG: hypothetical protein B1H03_05925 [Planctomycetales bacterium 4484_113]
MSAQGDNPYTRLRELLAKKRAQGLTFEETRELVALHERASADLSLSRETEGTEQSVLTPLVADSFNEVYGGVPFTRRRPFQFLLDFYRETPLVAWKYRLYLFITLAVFLIAASAGVVAVLTGDTVTPTAVLGEGLTRSFEEAVNRDANWMLAASIPQVMRPAASAGIIINNSFLTVFAFLIGILLGYWTLAIMFVNGYMLGFVTLLYVYTGLTTGRPELAWYFAAGVMPHGVLEIPAIVLGATAGVALGVSWIFPGHRMRLQAFQETAREVYHLILAAVLLLIIAGLIEAFVTPLGAEMLKQPDIYSQAERMHLYYLKVIFSLLLFGGFLTWLTAGRLEARKTQ